MSKRPTEWQSFWKPLILRFFGDCGESTVPAINEFMPAAAAVTSILALILGFWQDSGMGFFMAWLCMAYAYQTIPRKGDP
jgi:hypothetical protein